MHVFQQHQNTNKMTQHHIPDQASCKKACPSRPASKHAFEQHQQTYTHIQIKKNTAPHT